LEPLSLIYWIKAGLGALAAALCIVFNVNDLFLGITFGIGVYVISDRILKQIFIEKVEKPSVVTKTGIGLYIITWLFLWILMYTLYLWLAYELPI